MIALKKFIDVLEDGNITNTRMDVPKNVAKAGFGFNWKTNEIFDKNKNSVSLKRFSEKDAITMLKSLKNCERCKDSYELTYCKNCLDCVYSSKLINCYRVSSSDNMIRCEECNNCNDCVGCTGLEDEAGLKNKKNR